jgi:branched-chain amino acid transport system substrate-binding protein
MPIVMQRKKTFIGLLGLAVNTEFNYPNYFAMIPSGPDAKPAFTKGLFDIAMAQGAKPQTVAIVAATRSSPATPPTARARMPRRRTCAWSMTAPIRRRPRTLRPSCGPSRPATPTSSWCVPYPPDSVGMVRAVNEIGFKPKAIGGAMVGLQATAIKTQLGPLLNGWINYDFWLPVPKMEFPGVADLIKRYQAEGRGRRRRSARLLHGALGLRPAAGAAAGGRRRPRASTTPSSATTSAPTPSRPWSAT